MLKIRVTFVDDEEGQKELEELKKVLADVENKYNILSESRVYKGRNNSMYSNIYLDIEGKK